jgi:hypothetical protein
MPLTQQSIAFSVESGQREKEGICEELLPRRGHKGDALMFTPGGNLTLKQVVKQGLEEIGQRFLEPVKKAREGLLKVEGERRVAALRPQGQKV